MTQRRYNETEVEAIFQRAAEAPAPSASAASASQGLTLTELQEIGVDVGIPTEAIALAAQTVDVAGPPAARTFLGLPIGVSHTVHLGRKFSEEEWERFVVDLRETFGARGRVASHGSLRQWANGNLHALLEPTTDGHHRIRLKTTKGNAVGMLAGGLAIAGLSVVFLAAATIQRALGDMGMLAALGFLGLMGAGMFAASALQLPGWARTRRRQMEEVAARAVLAAATEGGGTTLPPMPGGENDIPPRYHASEHDE